MIWQPLDLNQICPADTQLTACTSFGYLYLSLLVELFGDAKENKIKKGKPNHGRHIDDDQVVRHVNPSIEKQDEKCKVSDSDEDEDRTHEDDQIYDFIVVGAGSAGCVIANRLTEIKKWKVLLLEAGPEEPDITLVPGLSTALLGSNVDWKYRTQYDGQSCLAQAGSTCSWPRGKMMGGSSAINSLAYVRGNKADYNEWAEMGNQGWSYKDVLPYFKKSENNLNIEAENHEYHAVGGPQPVSRYHYVDEPSIMMTEAFNQRGVPLVDFNGAQQLGTMQSQAISNRKSQRASANSAFIRPIRYIRKNLTVKPQSEVTEILIDPQTKTAYGVKYIRNGKWYKAVAHKEVIVSGGSINSPKLLMLSGLGPKEHLRSLNIDVVKDLPVGRNLHDHVTFNGVVVALSNKTATQVSNNEIIEELHKYKNTKAYSGPLAGNGPVNSVAFITTMPHLPAPDIQFQVDSASWKEYIHEPTLYEQLTIFPTSFYDGVIPRTMLLRPKSRGLLLLNSTDPVFGPPLLYPNYFAHDDDVHTLLAGVKFLLSLEETESFKSREAYFVRKPLEACAHYPWGTDAYYICMMKSYTSTPFHPVGTCKMGPKSDLDAVVDPRLRVYGVKGLRVIDASIMPVIPRGNTNAPSIMIGEKGADLIKEDWLNDEQKQ